MFKIVYLFKMSHACEMHAVLIQISDVSISEMLCLPLWGLLTRGPHVTYPFLDIPMLNVFVTYLGPCCMWHVIESHYFSKPCQYARW